MNFPITHFFKPSRTTIEAVVLPSDATRRLQAQLALYHPNSIVRVIRGRKSAKSSAFFNESAAALQFPDYFGENWDAFEECMQDMAEEVAANVVIVVTDASRLLADAEPMALPILLGILSRADRAWQEEAPMRGRQSQRLRVLLAERENGLWLLEERLAKVDIDIGQVDGGRAKNEDAKRMSVPSNEVPTEKEQAKQASGVAAD